MRPGDRKPVCGNTHVPAAGCERRNWELLEWLPGETLFSLISRQHRLWGHRLAAHTAQVLFGHHRQGFQHDFPSGLHNLVQATEGALGGVRSIALERTLLRYYRPFLTSAREEESVAAMASSSVAHLKFRLGLLTSRFRAHHPLKACLACIEEDRSQTGWAWWHVDHQYPGVWICLRHGERLFESATKSNGVGRFQWHLPHAPNLRAGVSAVSSACRSADEHLARLARLIVDVVDRPPVLRLDFPTLQQHYRCGLEDRGLMTVEGRLCLTSAAKELLDHVMPFRTVGELAALPRSLDEAKAQLTSMLRADRSGTHPLRHLVMVDWLFGSSANLLSRLEARDMSGRRRARDACQLTEIRDVRASDGAEVVALNAAVTKTGTPGITVRDALTPLLVAKVFDAHEKLIDALADETPPPEAPEVASREAAVDRLRRGWSHLLGAPWEQVRRYRDYLAGDAELATHHVVKGSEFPHVMVVMDDEDANGFLFSYDKLFGAGPLSDTDNENIATGKETSVDRTLRLLYVTCSRAEESLALVLWARNRAAAAEAIKATGWFLPEEVELLD